jgi:uncharacterized protein YndB with AHSA1/START domain
MAPVNRLVLQLEREVPAPREAVYRLLTEAEELAKWWGPNGFTVPSLDFDPRIGRAYRIVMQPPDGDVFHLSGEFREVEPPRRLAYTFRWDPPHPDDRETLVTLSLNDRGAMTVVRLTQAEFATAERYELHAQGWRETLDRLERLSVTAGASGCARAPCPPPPPRSQRRRPDTSWEAWRAR